MGECHCTVDMSARALTYSILQFHTTCVNLAVLPEGRWFCDDCKKRKRNVRGGKRRTAGGRNGR
jgi:hypothetical protein